MKDGLYFHPGNPDYRDNVVKAMAALNDSNAKGLKIQAEKHAEAFQERINQTAIEQFRKTGLKLGASNLNKIFKNPEHKAELMGAVAEFRRQNADLAALVDPDYAKAMSSAASTNLMNAQARSQDAVAAINERKLFEATDLEMTKARSDAALQESNNAYIKFIADMEKLAADTEKVKSDVYLAHQKSFVDNIMIVYETADPVVQAQIIADLFPLVDENFKKLEAMYPEVSKLRQLLANLPLIKDKVTVGTVGWARDIKPEDPPPGSGDSNFSTTSDDVLNAARE